MLFTYASARMRERLLYCVNFTVKFTTMRLNDGMFWCIDIQFHCYSFQFRTQSNRNTQKYTMKKKMCYQKEHIEKMVEHSAIYTKNFEK